MKTLRLSAQLNNLDKVVSFVADCAQAQGFSGERVLSVELVVEEVFVNICRYAYCNGQGQVEITCNAGSSPERLTIEIADDGKPFNPLLSFPVYDQNEDVDISRRRIGGLGILMIIQMTDDIHYDRTGESNRLTLSFYGPKE